MSHKRMSAEARIHYVERRHVDRERTLERKRQRKHAEFYKGVRMNGGER